RAKPSAGRKRQGNGIVAWDAYSRAGHPYQTGRRAAVSNPPMKISPVLAAALLAFLSLSTAARAQSPQHLVGDRIGGTMQLDAKAGTVADTATLTFGGGDRGAVYTIDFTVRHD